MLKFVCALAAALALAAPAVAAAKAVPAPAKVHRVVLPKDVRPDRYEVRITPNAEKLSFEGQAKIALTVLKPTSRIELNAADIAFRRVTLSGAGAPKVTADAKTETVELAFARPLQPGRYTLSIDYSGRIFQQASGFFALDYDTAQGKKRALFTQFENSDARRFAPSWDEPGVKSVFALTVVAPTGEMAVSNMPVARTRTLGGGLTETTFADTPKMSSYLLFFGLGDFERIHRQVGKTDVGVIVRRGETAKAQFGLDAAAGLLSYYNAYFGTPYPLPKLDLVAGPGRSQFFCAMENWGAIFYFDSCFLVDPKLSTEADRQRAFVVIAHEMAHQWFGDLVTMAWWDDLWLNEGFASWMENKATDHFHPEWRMWLQAAGEAEGAKRLDAAAGTHPIITPIPDVFAAGTAFDDITYQKGQAVIRMLETYVGADAFRTGVRNYIARHAYGNTVTDDFWREMDKVSPRKVTGVAHDFTLQPGVPLIEAAPAAGGVRLTQSRFKADGTTTPKLTWRTPVLAGPAGGKPSWEGLVSSGAPQTVPNASGGPLVVNAGQSGYFRTAYAPALWAKLSADFMRLSPADQMGLMRDSQALGEAGRGKLSDYLALSRNAGPDADPLVLRLLALQLGQIDEAYDGAPGQAAFRAFARARLEPVLARVGWDAKPGEAPNMALLRGSLLTTLSRVDDPQVVAEALRRFEAWLAKPEILDAETRRVVLTIAAAHADAKVWEALHAKALTERDPTQRERFYGYLGASHDRALAQRALDLALTPEPGPTLSPEIVSQVGRIFPDLAYDFALAHRAKLEELLEPDSRVSFFPRLASASRDPAMLGKLAAFETTIPASTVGEVRKAEAQIRHRREVIDTRLPEVTAWLATHPG